MSDPINCIIIKIEQNFLSLARGSLYSFQDGTVYKYQFEGSTVTTLPGVQNDVTKLSVTGTAEVSAQGQCAFVLKLSNVNIQGPDGKVTR